MNLSGNVENEMCDYGITGDAAGVHGLAIYTSVIFAGGIIAIANANEIPARDE
jgi:hypothetical protein